MNAYNIPETQNSFLEISGTISTHITKELVEERKDSHRSGFIPIYDDEFLLGEFFPMSFYSWLVVSVLNHLEPMMERYPYEQLKRL